MTLSGPASQSSGRVSPEGLVVSSGPVVLSVRPLSPYQQQMIDAILALRVGGWTDRQIANHFNEIGYLAPRGGRWIPQSVFSMRRKYEKQLERLGGG